MTVAHSDQAAASPGFEEWRGEWRDARPEWRLLETFMPVTREAPAVALEMLVGEWLDAALAISEPDVARRKLAWWHDEVSGLGEGRARHPLTTAIAGGGRARDVSPSLARAVGAALAMVDIESVTSTAELIDASLPLAIALDEAGIALELWRPHPAARAMAASLVGDLLRDWPRFARPERGLVPLALLARHGLDRSGARSGSEAAACDALLRDFALELGAAVGHGHGGDLAAARLAVARLWLAAAARAPRAAREGRLQAPRFRLLWTLWRLARESGRAGQ